MKTTTHYTLLYGKARYFRGVLSRRKDCMLVNYMIKSPSSIHCSSPSLNFTQNCLTDFLPRLISRVWSVTSLTSKTSLSKGMPASPTSENKYRFFVPLTSTSTELGLTLVIGYSLSVICFLNPLLNLPVCAGTRTLSPTLYGATDFLFLLFCCLFSRLYEPIIPCKTSSSSTSFGDLSSKASRGISLKFSANSFRFLAQE
eukprot:Lithocolla_globosa_v1_NODE_16_length_10446_cov_10.815802.p7 type:complete len:200 gc:universal NODE_16_length_10446_cov_10.815802:7394-7993(+)